MRPTVYTVARPGPGTVSTMGRPRGGDWLDEEVTGLRRLGVDALVCLLTDAELGELGLAGEAEAAGRAGLHHVWLPTADRGVPDPAIAGPVLTALAGRLGQGQHIAVHCRFGLGRASLLAAALLVATNTDPDDAWHLITAARGHPVPDTDEQRAWVYRHRFTAGPSR
jgi:protein-tyrosine phosphatase